MLHANKKTANKSMAAWKISRYFKKYYTKFARKHIKDDKEEILNR